MRIRDFGLWLCFCAGCFNPEAVPMGTGDTETATGAGTTGASSTGVPIPDPVPGTGGSSDDDDDDDDDASEGTGFAVVCGDGFIDGDEECDDFNNDPEDGCDGDCRVEDGWFCIGEPSECGLPDLSVRVVDVTDGPSGPVVSFVAVNSGFAPTGPFQIGVWADLPDGLDNPPMLGAGAEVIVPVPNLGPGEVLEDAATVTGVLPIGSTVAYVGVDLARVVTEYDEVNNLSLGFPWSSDPVEFNGVYQGSFGAVEIPTTGGAAIIPVEVPTVGTVPRPYFSVNISHPRVHDLRLTVTAPDGAELVLYDRNGFGADFRTTTFDEFATESIDSAFPPYVGRFIPTGFWDLAPSIAGSWELRVEDLAAGPPGRVNDFAVHLYEYDP